jgi:hypothetical protein
MNSSPGEGLMAMGDAHIAARVGLPGAVATDAGKSPSNTAAITAIRTHHAQLNAELRELTAAVLSAAQRGEDRTALAGLCDWYRITLLPHIAAEEHTLYSPGRELAPVRLLVHAMLDEHCALVRLVAELALAQKVVRAATLAASAQSLFNAHLAKEDHLLLPALDRAGWDLTQLHCGL